MHDPINKKKLKGKVVHLHVNNVADVPLYFFARLILQFLLYFKSYAKDVCRLQRGEDDSFNCYVFSPIASCVASFSVLAFSFLCNFCNPEILHFYPGFAIAE